MPQEQIRVHLFSARCAPDALVKKIASIEGLVDVYVWHEGVQGLPKFGALFMKEFIFEPLFKLKKDAKLCLYWLRGWILKKISQACPFQW